MTPPIWGTRGPALQLLAGYASRMMSTKAAASGSSSGSGSRGSRGKGLSGGATAGSGNNGGILKNEGIKLPSMRVVYKNAETGASEWQVLTRKDALALAKKMSLDLVLVDAKSTPPVCRLDDFGHMLMEKRKKAKEKKTSQKIKSLKEIYVKAGIDPHDLETKLNKCKEFLADGHQVKVVMMATKVAMTNNPLALDEATLKVLENLESHVGTVQQPKVSNPMRRDFLLNPGKSAVSAASPSGSSTD